MTWASTLTRSDRRVMSTTVSETLPRRVRESRAERNRSDTALPTMVPDGGQTCPASSASGRAPGTVASKPRGESPPTPRASTSRPVLGMAWVNAVRTIASRPPATPVRTEKALPDGDGSTVASSSPLLPPPAAETQRAYDISVKRPGGGEHQASTVEEGSRARRRRSAGRPQSIYSSTATTERRARRDNHHQHPPGRLRRRSRRPSGGGA